MSDKSMKVYEVTRRQVQTLKDITVTVEAKSASDAAHRAAGKLADMGVSFTTLISVRVAE